ncbi:DUF6339 family protein [Streptomyces sp. NRRL F-5727]|uniref:DUF6339 family protein n=1 Tax=Streptomyces sp. NRRL F-5727 TaxID=1463871 RepID=UPI0004C760FB|nr:DUF6339 family protein [Streptomyces sp. NRRL F-5727]
MIEKPYHVPLRLGLLSAAAAEPFLTEDLLGGVAGHAGVDLDKVVDRLPEEDPRWEVEPIRDLIEDAMHAFEDNRTQADAWLAPRLHAALRLTRREAADRRLWTHLALAVAPDYVAWRHFSRKTSKISPERFRGAADRQCFSRLWWAAEMFRDGSDYAPVVTACGNQDLIHSALRRELIDHRPTAQALVQVMERGVAVTGREIEGLMTAISAAGATLVYDALAPDVPRDPSVVREWIEEPARASVPRHVLPDGPHEEPVPKKSVNDLADFFADLFETAPVRGRAVKE